MALQFTCAHAACSQEVSCVCVSLMLCSQSHNMCFFLPSVSRVSWYRSTPPKEWLNNTYSRPTVVVSQWGHIVVSRLCLEILCNLWISMIVPWHEADYTKSLAHNLIFSPYFTTQLLSPTVQYVNTIKGIEAAVGHCIIIFNDIISTNVVSKWSHTRNPSICLIFYRVNSHLSKTHTYITSEFSLNGYALVWLS